MILICFGTRPEWLKIKPLLKYINNYTIFFTGQHEDLLKNEIKDYSKLIIYSKVKKFSDNRLNNILSSIMDNFPQNKYDAVVVQGDTASAFACALAAFNNNKKIIYLEAGLRSFDLNHPYPEEGYRQMITRISSINLCPTELSLKNLVSENVPGKNFVVGNTVLDNLLELKDKTIYNDEVLITLHRRENLPLLNIWIKQIVKIAKYFDSIKFNIIEHPNHKINLPNINNLIKSEPYNHGDFLNRLIKTKLLITDSGGLQEEGSFFNKKVIVCREVTERPEGIESGHIVMCKEPKNLFKTFSKEILTFEINEACPYGDGNSSEKIIKILKKNDFSV
jgi:UDP-N-acetylglucosamine 2-epimerase (non-hydrolysing)